MVVTAGLAAAVKGAGLTGFMSGLKAGSLGALGLKTGAVASGKAATAGTVTGHLLTTGATSALSSLALGSGGAGGGGGAPYQEGATGGRALPMSGVDPQGPQIIPFEQRVMEVLGDG